MNMVNKYWILTLGFAAAISLSLPAASYADIKLESVAGGATLSSVWGDNYQTFSQAIGGVAEVALGDTSILGTGFQFHGLVSFLPYSVRGLTNYTVNQWAFLVGLETTHHNVGGWLKPFISFDLGGAYSSLVLPAGITSSIQNASFLFTAQARPGVEIPLMGNFSLQLAAPIRVVVSANPFTTLNGEASVRFAL